MKKLTRFAIIVALFVISFCLLYSIIPLVVFLFGGASFSDVSQHPAYAFFGSILIIVILAVIFNECFDEFFYEKD